MRYLAILLLAPWLLILCGIFWVYPKELRRTAGRRLYDVLAVLLMSALAIGAALMAFDQVELPALGKMGRASGAIWQQVLPALCGYGAFTIGLVVAMWLRHVIWGRRARAVSDKSRLNTGD
ncbi:MAG: hypothetical protein WC617_11310 [Rhodanobacter sp.]|jgi:hypothetical protein